MGCRFIVKTDQRSLRYMLEQRVIPGEFLQWVAKLMGHDFEIQYRPGIENKAADTLTWVPAQVELVAITCPVEIGLSSMLEQIEENTRLAKIERELQSDLDSHPHYSLDQGRLLYKGRIILHSSSTLIPTLLHEYHSSPVRGHSGFLRTYKWLTSNLYWWGMKNDIKKFVEECTICQ